VTAVRRDRAIVRPIVRLATTMVVAVAPPPSTWKKSNADSRARRAAAMVSHYPNGPRNKSRRSFLQRNAAVSSSLSSLEDVMRIVPQQTPYNNGVQSAMGCRSSWHPSCRSLRIPPGGDAFAADRGRDGRAAPRSWVVALVVLVLVLLVPLRRRSDLRRCSRSCCPADRVQERAIPTTSHRVWSTLAARQMRSRRSRRTAPEVVDAGANDKAYTPRRPGGSSFLSKPSCVWRRMLRCAPPSIDQSIDRSIGRIKSSERPSFERLPFEGRNGTGGKQGVLHHRRFAAANATTKGTEQKIRSIFMQPHPCWTFHHSRSTTIAELALLSRFLESSNRVGVRWRTLPSFSARRTKERSRKRGTHRTMAEGDGRRALEQALGGALLWSVQSEGTPLPIVRSVINDCAGQLLRVVPGTDGYMYIPLHHAVEAGAGLEVIQCLVETCPASVRVKTADARGGPDLLPLHLAFQRREPLRVRRFPRSDEEQDVARAAPDLRVVQYLLQQYPEAIQVPTASGDLALHCPSNRWAYRRTFLSKAWTLPNS
jgi:hypothetical protein